MGWLSKVLGTGVVDAAEGISNIVNSYVETPDEKRAAELLLTKIAQAPGMAQVELNKIEATHRSIFVAGWRPGVGWVCVLSLGIYYIPQFLIAQYVWISMYLASCGTEIGCTIQAFPVEITGLMELMIAMLGLAGLRTVEKFGGKTR